MSIPDSILGRWSHHYSGEAPKQAQLSIRDALIKEKGLKRLVAEADARFKVPPPRRIGRVRMVGETGEQLILPSG